MSYWYIEGKAEKDRHRHFCWAKEPTYVCRYRNGIIEAEGGGDFGANHPLLREAVAIGMTRLDRIIKDAHRRGFAVRHRDDKGKLTEDCASCGCKLKRLGFAAWEEQPPEEEDAQSRIADRLGFSNYRQVGERRYFRTKKKAEAWASKQAGDA